MSDDRIPPELEDDLRSLRERPREEFGRELDRRAAARIGGARTPFRPRAWMGTALGAAAAVAVAVVVIAGSSGGGSSHSLDVAAVPDATTLSVPSGGAAGKGAAPAPSAAGPAPSAEAAPQPLTTGTRQVAAGTPIVVRYGVGASGEAQISIAGRMASTHVPAGSGHLSISTKSLPAGAQELRVKLRGAGLAIPIRIR